MYGEEGLLDGDWREKLIVEGILVTDARSLYDHTHATGSLPAERSVMLDLLAAKELTEKGIIKLRWCPTHVQLADHLTKQMTSEFLNHYLETGKLSLTQTKEQQAQEQHLAKLRKEQRQRRKTKMKAAKDHVNTSVLYVF